MCYATLNRKTWLSDAQQQIDCVSLTGAGLLGRNEFARLLIARAQDGESIKAR